MPTDAAGARAGGSDDPLQHPGAIAMDLSSLLDPIRRLPGYQALLHSIRQGDRLPPALALPRSARVAVAAALAAEGSGPVLYFAARQDPLLSLSPQISPLY